MVTQPFQQFAQSARGAYFYYKAPGPVLQTPAFSQNLCVTSRPGYGILEKLQFYDKTGRGILRGSIRKQSRKILTAKRHLLCYRVLRSTKERFAPLPCICRFAAILRCCAVFTKPLFSYVARAFSAAPFFWRCFATIGTNHLRRALAAAGAAAILCALPTPVFADGATAIDQLGQLQTLAESYVKETSSDADPLLLTLSFTRTGVYNGMLWQLTAGARDLEFESYALDADESLADLMGMGATEMPSGGAVDLGHALASVNLVYQSVPVAGSWGGDCMELVQQYAGQAQDAQGYAAIMADTFAIEGEGSVFSMGDLRADLDSVNIGAQLSADSSLAQVMGDYYDGLTDYDRAYQFIALSFGTVDTSNTEAFRQTVYDTLVNDTGMQLLLYLNEMWDAQNGWSLKEEYAPALRGATDLLADYLAEAVNGEKVKADSGTRMQTMGGQALSDALNLLGDSDAAGAALEGAAQAAGSTAASAGSTVDGALTEATATLRAGFDATVFQVVMLVVGTGALFGMIVCLILLFARMRER